MHNRPKQNILLLAGKKNVLAYVNYEVQPKQYAYDTRIFKTSVY